MLKSYIVLHTLNDAEAFKGFRTFTVQGETIEQAKEQAVEVLTMREDTRDWEYRVIEIGEDTGPIVLSK
jgi:hypothetical protein